MPASDVIAPVTDFPVFLPGSAKSAFADLCPTSIPMASMRKVDDRRYRLHHGASLDELAQRGGLDPREIQALYVGRKLSIGGPETMVAAVEFVRGLARGLGGEPALFIPVTPRIVKPEHRSPWVKDPISPWVTKDEPHDPSTPAKPDPLRKPVPQAALPLSASSPVPRPPTTQVMTNEPDPAPERSPPSEPSAALVANDPPLLKRSTSPWVKHDPVLGKSRGISHADLRKLYRDALVDHGPLTVADLAIRLNRAPAVLYKWLRGHPHLVERIPNTDPLQWRWRSDHAPTDGPVTPTTAPAGPPPSPSDEDLPFPEDVVDPPPDVAQAAPVATPALTSGPTAHPSGGNDYDPPPVLTQAAQAAPVPPPTLPPTRLASPTRPAPPVDYAHIPRDVVQKLVDAVDQHRHYNEQYMALPPYRSRDREYRFQEQQCAARVKAADVVARRALRDLLAYLKYALDIRPGPLPGLQTTEIRNLSEEDEDE